MGGFMPTNYYNLSDTYFPRVIDAVIESIRYKICSNLYPDETYTASKSRFILSDAGEFALRSSADASKNSNVSFPFTVYSLGDVELDMGRRSFNTLAADYYSDLSTSTIYASPWKLVIPMTSFFAKASDYFRALQIFQKDQSQKDILTAPLYVNGVLTSIPVYLRYEIAKGDFAFQIQQQLKVGKIYDLTHNITAHFSDLRSDSEISPVDDIEISLYSLDMKPLSTAVVKDTPEVLTVYPLDASSGIIVSVQPIITFSKGMVEASAENSIEVDPFTPISYYTWNTSGTILTLEFKDNLISGVVYDITVGADATSGDQVSMGEDFTFSFTTDGV